MGVFVDESVREMQLVREFCGLDWVRLHGGESESAALRLGRRVIKAISVEDALPPLEAYPKAILLLNAPKGRPRPVGAARASIGSLSWRPPAAVRSSWPAA